MIFQKYFSGGNLERIAAMSLMVYTYWLEIAFLRISVIFLEFRNEKSRCNFVMQGALSYKKPS
jgi:hypothetical protein